MCEPPTATAGARWQPGRDEADAHRLGVHLVSAIGRGKSARALCRQVDGVSHRFEEAEEGGQLRYLLARSRARHSLPQVRVYTFRCEANYPCAVGKSAQLVIA
jgi:hypothetical protein